MPRQRSQSSHKAPAVMDSTVTGPPTLKWSRKRICTSGRALSTTMRFATEPTRVKLPASVEDMAEHVDHAVRRIGIEHVGLSSDFDGGGGVRGWQNAAESAGLTAALAARGYDARAIGLLWSGNFLRVWRRAEALAAP